MNIKPEDFSWQNYYHDLSNIKGNGLLKLNRVIRHDIPISEKLRNMEIILKETENAIQEVREAHLKK
jgi:hypothetical protein